VVIDTFWNLARRTAPAAAERREAHRDRVLLGGKIVYGPGYTADCCIRDLTPRGAKVALPPHQYPPERFVLIVVRDGLAHRARTLWSHAREAGVAFEDTHNLLGQVPPQMQPIRRIWTELAPRP